MKIHSYNNKKSNGSGLSKKGKTIAELSQIRLLPGSLKQPLSKSRKALKPPSFDMMHRTKPPIKQIKNPLSQSMFKRKLSAPVLRKPTTTRPVLSPSVIFNQTSMPKLPQRKKRRAELAVEQPFQRKRIKTSLTTSVIQNSPIKPPPAPVVPIDPELLDWRDTDPINIPPIIELKPDDWPDIDDAEADKEEDLTNEAYYIRHQRAEEREKLFYARLQEWRREGRKEEKEMKNKLKVSDRPRGPWQFKLENYEPPLTVDLININKPVRFNYYSDPTGGWIQPAKLIRVLQSDEPDPIESEPPDGRRGKDLFFLMHGRPTETTYE